LDWADLVVASPGVPPSNSFLQETLSRGLRVWSELELGWRMSKAPVIAITGTNGKTTTTRLIQHVLESAGIPSLAAGNIGLPFVESVRHHTEGKTIVCEVSSAQLFFIEEFRPRVAVVLNVADDHYDWHTGYEDYLGAKTRITENQTSEDVLVINAFDKGCIQIARSSKARICGFGHSSPDEVREVIASSLSVQPELVAGVDEVSVRLASPSEMQAIDVMPISDIRLQGRHNLENVLAAATAAAEYGVEPAEFASAVASFHGLPHRMTFVRELDSVRYIDDSKATNPHATLRALEDLENVVLIAGGDAKGLDLSSLKTAAKRIKGMVVMGTAAHELELLFRDEVPVEHAADIEEAVLLAQKLATASGDVVLLSPACASWDQYSGYVERGERFQKAVLAL
jgi:UDP-N-acetylmuramoylalanine--D-glutamate ligase